MQPFIKLKFKRYLFLFFAIFVLLFSFRLLYGYVFVSPSSNTQAQFFENNENTSRNYASKAYEVKSKSPESAISTKVDQKYEKIANIQTTADNFESEEKTARQNIEQYEALIQFEQKRGNVGNRSLLLYIGVPPENFDSLYQQLIKIGEVQAKQITKKDKTNEYKALNANKKSLETIRASLLELKTKDGKIEEFIQLDDRILAIEQELQGLGVSLGNFDDENEFCTVQFALREQKVASISAIHRIKVAFEWTVRIYFRLIGGIFLTLFAAYLLLVAIDKFKFLIQKNK